MKTSYSTFSNPVWGAFKLFGEGRSEQDYFNFCGSVWRHGGSSGKDPDILYASIYACYLWKFCRIKHLFLSDGVAEFCESSAKEISDMYSKPLPECDTVDVRGKRFAPWLVVSAPGNNDALTGGFAIHFPAKTKRRSIVVMPSIAIPDAIKRNTLHDCRYYWFAAEDGEDVALLQKDSSSHSFYGSGERMVKLIYGLSLYLDAFPDTVTQSTRDDVKELGHYTGDVSTVAVHEIAREDNERSTSPHFRRGHFRILASEVFKRKRGQVVFVRGSFVRGHAVDVGPDLTTNNPSQ